MSDVYNVLFLCTGNSARSIIAECIMNRVGAPRFRGFSAGSHPAGQVNSYALEMLQALDYATHGLRPKSWDEFAAPGAPRLDLVITVCDSAAGEVCPVWPGGPAAAHWGLADPAAVEGLVAAKRAAFAETHRVLHARIAALADLPIDALDRPLLLQRLGEIGELIPEAG